MPMPVALESNEKQQRRRRSRDYCSRRQGDTQPLVTPPRRNRSSVQRCRRFCFVRSGRLKPAQRDASHHAGARATSADGFATAFRRRSRCAWLLQGADRRSLRWVASGFCFSRGCCTTSHPEKLEFAAEADDRAGPLEAPGGVAHRRLRRRQCPIAATNARSAIRPMPYDGRPALNASALPYAA
jgi:hypothetical protein